MDSVTKGQTVEVTRAEMVAAIEGAHADRYPAGCPGWCDACVARCRPSLVVCPAGCGNPSLYAQAGKVPPHDVRVGARAGYRGRWQACDGGGRPVRP